MKKITVPILIAVLAAVPLSFVHFEAKEVNAATALATDLDLNDCNETEIRDYYKNLNSLSDSEKQGKNLLKNLKPILKNNQKYYGYDGSLGEKIWQMYEITDRDWTKSPASEIEGYNASTNTVTGYKYGSSKDKPGSNPYLHALYVDRTAENKMHAWVREEYESDKDKISHGSNREWAIDREHIWAKSQGFEAEGAEGARGDPMHLWAGDSDVNSSLHNDQMYGYVDSTASPKAGKWSYGKNNFVGKSLTLGTELSTEKVFEPQDSDKGDIARAIFYLVARYNNLAGDDTITSDNPNLELVQSNEVLKAYTSTSSSTGKMGIMTDLLNWHHLDPVDEYEIHRNNLLFRNYTNNRNPFIDFPDWVDYIWGTASYNGKQYQSYNETPTGVANPSSDAIYKGSETPVTPSDPNTPAETTPENKGLDTKTIIIIAVVAAVVVIVLIIIFVSLSKRNKKKVLKTVKKTVKKSTKKSSKKK